MQEGYKKKHVSETEDFDKAVPEYLLRLDLACGKNKKEGFKGVDISGDADIIHDLDVLPWPFEDNSVYEIHCSHFVEHVTDLIKFMEECHRILVPLGTMTIITPYYTSERAWQDPTHVRAITDVTFNYFDKEWLKNNGLSHYPINTDFEVLHRRHYVEPEWETRSLQAREWAMRHYFNVVADIQFILKKKN